jgi:hypothetical protein
MKAVYAYLIGAVVLAAVGFVAFRVAGFEREMAAVEENVATLGYSQAEANLAAAEGYATYASWVPGVSRRAQADMRAHRATLQYWQRKYDELLPRDADPVGAVEGESTDIQLLVANGAYRVGQARATNKESAIQVLNEAITGYMAVLKSDDWDERAAYNYEYLVRLRDELTKGRRNALPPPPSEKADASHGEAGAPMKAMDMEKFEIYVPLESDERSNAAEAGKSTPIKRKG